MLIFNKLNSGKNGKSKIRAEVAEINLLKNGNIF